MDEAKRRQVEDDAKRAEWDAYTMASGNGFKMTNEETYVVYKLVSDALALSDNGTIQHKIGDESAVGTAMRLYMRMSAAMPQKPEKAG